MTLKLYELNYFLNRFEAKWSLPFFFSRPVCIQLEFTNVCQLRCQTCARSWWNPHLNKPVYLSLASLKKLSYLFSSASEVIIGGYGEPLLHPDFSELLNFLRSFSHLQIRLITNGLNLEKRLPDLSGLNKLVLSMDGVSDVYRAHRGCDFTRFTQNLSAFLAVYQTKIDLEINVVWNRRTQQNLPEILEFLADYPAIKRVNLQAERMYSPIRSLECLFLPEELHQLSDTIDNLRKKNNKIELIVPDFLSADIPCRQPLESIFVLADGEIMACCSAVFKGHPYRFPLVGFPKNGWEFFFFWNAKILRQYRLAFRCKCLYPEPCQNCAFRRLAPETLSRFL